MGWLIQPQEDHECELPRITHEKKYVDCQWQCDVCRKIYEVVEHIQMLGNDPRDVQAPMKVIKNEWKLRVVKRIS